MVRGAKGGPLLGGGNRSMAGHWCRSSRRSLEEESVDFPISASCVANSEAIHSTDTRTFVDPCLHINA
jgi:hypothetical protein